jgi:hypothetical protein
MAYTRKTTKSVETTTAAEEAVKEETVEQKPQTVSKATPVEHNGDDLIPCRSVVNGELICIAKKTGNKYIWSSYGDVTEVEYQDLMGLRAARSRFVFAPFFIIEDEDLLEELRWKQVKELYDNLYSVADIYKVLELPINQFREALEKMPTSFRKTVASEVSHRLDEGLFDSIQKVKAIDEICGTDLQLLL